MQETCIFVWSFASSVSLQDMRHFLAGVFTAGNIKMQMPAEERGWWWLALAILEEISQWRLVDLQRRSEEEKKSIIVACLAENQWTWQKSRNHHNIEYVPCNHSQSYTLSDRHFSAHARGPGWSAGCPVVVFPWTWQQSLGSTTSSHCFFPRLWSTGQQRESWTTDMTTHCMAWGPDTGAHFHLYDFCSPLPLWLYCALLLVSC